MNIKNKPNRKSISPFNAKVTIGLNRMYSDDLINKEDIIISIQEHQKGLTREKGIYLSTSVSEAIIVLNDQAEPHLVLNFINYPKFPLEEGTLKLEIENLVITLMNSYSQNRTVIEYRDETVMLDFSDEVDPKINSESE